MNITYIQLYFKTLATYNLQLVSTWGVTKGYYTKYRLIYEQLKLHDIKITNSLVTGTVTEDRQRSPASDTVRYRPPPCEIHRESQQVSDCSRA